MSNPDSFWQKKKEKEGRKAVGPHWRGSGMDVQTPARFGEARSEPASATASLCQLPLCGWAYPLDHEKWDREHKWS